MFKLDKGIKPPTRETYIQYFKELKSKGFIIDYYDDDTPLPELERIQKHITKLLFQKWIDNTYDKDLRST